MILFLQTMQNLSWGLQAKMWMPGKEYIDSYIHYSDQYFLCTPHNFSFSFLLVIALFWPGILFSSHTMQRLFSYSVYCTHTSRLLCNWIPYDHAHGMSLNYPSLNLLNINKKHTQMYQSWLKYALPNSPDIRPPPKGCCPTTEPVDLSLI
jgi:hypothetical protein